MIDRCEWKTSKACSYHAAGARRREQEGGRWDTYLELATTRCADGSPGLAERRMLEPGEEWWPGGGDHYADTRAVRARARELGQSEIVSICDRALAGDGEAWSYVAGFVLHALWAAGKNPTLHRGLSLLTRIDPPSWGSYVGARAD